MSEETDVNPGGDNIENYGASLPYVSPFLQYLVDTINASLKTVKNYAWALGSFNRFLNAFYPTVADLQFVEREHIIAFKVFMERKGRSANSVRVSFAAMKRFYSYLLEEGIIDRMPFPSKLTTMTTVTDVVYIPPVEKIFLCRKNRRVRARSAAFFEFALSTGMRVHEVRCVRMDNIDWNAIPYDKETGSPSKFFKGKVTLPAREHRLKGKQTRICWLSNIARRVVLQYVSRSGVPLNSRFPLFPMREKHADMYLYDATKGVLPTSAGGQQKGYKPLVEIDANDKPRVLGYTDITDEEIKGQSMSAQFLASLRQSREHANRDAPIERQATLHTKRKKIWFHSHMLRYMFTNAIYYRNMYGERINFERLKELLGHSGNFSNMTMHYLKSLDFIQDDETWERLYNGKPQDWFNLLP